MKIMGFLLRDKTLSYENKKYQPSVEVIQVSGENNY